MSLGQGERFSPRPPSRPRPGSGTQPCLAGAAERGAAGCPGARVPRSGSGGPAPTAHAPEPPTPTRVPEGVTPTPTPGPEGTCVDGMTHVQDLSYDDRNLTAPPVLGPGQAFAKSWRVRNSGTCPWDASYALYDVGGNHPAAQMGGSPVTVQWRVMPGETYDLNGTYTPRAIRACTRGSGRCVPTAATFSVPVPFGENGEVSGSAGCNTPFCAVRAPGPRQQEHDHSQCHLRGERFAMRSEPFGHCLLLCPGHRAPETPPGDQKEGARHPQS